jgi:hypothetical protein
MRTYAADRKSADGFLLQQKQYIGFYLADQLVDVGPDYEDRHENTDFTFQTRAVRVSARVRDYKFLHFQDFTIRAQRSSGAPTELDKLLAGFGDYFLYAVKDPTGRPGRPFAAWAIVDLTLFRVWYKKHGRSVAVTWNEDGRSAFKAFLFYDCYTIRHSRSLPLIHWEDPNDELSALDLIGVYVSK